VVPYTNQKDRRCRGTVKVRDQRTDLLHLAQAELFAHALLDQLDEVFLDRADRAARATPATRWLNRANQMSEEDGEPISCAASAGDGTESARWSMDFESDRLVDERWFRVLTVVDQFIRECLLLYADRTLSGEKVAVELECESVLLARRCETETGAVAARLQ
jgi:hypothetical protein